MRNLAPLACGLAVACASGSAWRQRADAIGQDVKSARDLNAAACAPREIATAEANLRLEQLALDQGDSPRAGAHLDRAAPGARDALARSRDCGNTKVAGQRPAEPQPATPSVSAKDTDGDGVPDVDDLCPDVPGPAEHRGCPLFTDRDGAALADDDHRRPDLPAPKVKYA